MWPDVANVDVFNDKHLVLIAWHAAIIERHCLFLKKHFLFLLKHEAFFLPFLWLICQGKGSEKKAVCVGEVCSKFCYKITCE
jgi:hypothetical protein